VTVIRHGPEKKFFLTITTIARKENQMFGLGKLTSAIATLTSNVLALAATTAEINQGVRARLHLDTGDDEPAQLTGSESAASGRRRSKTTAK